MTTLQHRRSTAPDTARPTPSTLPRRMLRDPLRRGLTSLPLALAAVPAALTGSGDAAARRRFRSAGIEAEPRRPIASRVLAHSALIAVPALLAFALALMVLYLVGAGYLYPLRPDAIACIGHPFSADARMNNSWGGPTLFGAWMAHSCVALALQLPCLVLLRRLASLQSRMSRRLLAEA